MNWISHEAVFCWWC